MFKSLDFENYLSQINQPLKLQGLQPKTVQAYYRTLQRVNERIKKPPNNLTFKDLKDYFANLVVKYSWSTVKIARKRKNLTVKASDSKRYRPSILKIDVFQAY